MRSLNPDEAELWRRVTATIRPLSRETAETPEPLAPEPVVWEAAAAAPVSRPKPRTATARAAPPLAPPKPRPGTTLDGTWDRKLRSGALEPDRTLDLHGMNLEGAWSAIDNALERAIDAGDRVLLLITGHARRGEPPILRGRIRAAVHDWLAASRHAARIAAVRAAHPRHGGGGSLYIVLRRR